MEGVDVRFFGAAAESLTAIHGRRGVNLGDTAGLNAFIDALAEAERLWKALPDARVGAGGRDSGLVSAVRQVRPKGVRVMDDWKRAFREGFLAVATRQSLERVRGLLLDDSPSLVQKVTAVNAAGVAGSSAGEDACAGACLVAQLSWRERTVYRAYFDFSLDSDAIDLALRRKKVVSGGDPERTLTSRDLTRWYDRTPRDEMRRELIAEIDLALAGPPP